MFNEFIDDTPISFLHKQLKLKGVEVDLVNDVRRSRGVQDCGATSPCAKRPCQHSGTCYEVTETVYRCQCPPGWTGKTSDQ